MVIVMQGAYAHTCQVRQFFNRVNHHVLMLNHDVTSESTPFVQQEKAAKLAASLLIIECGRYVIP